MPVRVESLCLRHLLSLSHSQYRSVETLTKCFPCCLGDLATSKPQDATTQLGKIVERDFICKFKSKTACITCPTPKLETGKCPEGAKCKRGLEPRELLDPRTKVPFDKIKSAAWKPGNIIETSGLSACSVMAVYDQNHWAMAHVPPARADPKNPAVLIATAQDVIDEYKAAMTAAMKAAHMVGAQAKGYLLVSNMMGQEERQSMQQWYHQAGVVQLTVHGYDAEQTIPGSGNLAISRETHAWPPSVSFL